MPVIVHRKSTPLAPTPPAPTPPTPTPETLAQPTSPTPPPRRRLATAAKALAFVVAEIRKAGHHSNAEIAKCLNDRGLRAPSGGPFSPETTRQILIHLQFLGLGDGPRSVSTALSARASKRRATAAAELAELQARRERQHPDWD